MGDLALTEPEERFVRFLLSIGLALVTWALLLLIGGMVLRFGPLTPASVLQAAVIGLLVWPIAALAPWRDDPTRRLARLSRSHRQSLVIAAGLASLLAILDLLGRSGVPRRVLSLPTELLGVSFAGPATLYRGLFGIEFAAGVVQFGEWYLIGLWLFGLGWLFSRLGRPIGGR